MQLQLLLHHLLLSVWYFVRCVQSAVTVLEDCGTPLAGSRIILPILHRSLFNVHSIFSQFLLLLYHKHGELSSVYSCFLPARDDLFMFVTRILCSCAPGYTLLYHTIPICQVAGRSAVSWCVVSCRDVSGRGCGGVEKAFSFYYIM